VGHVMPFSIEFQEMRTASTNERNSALSQSWWKASSGGASKAIFSAEKNTIRSAAFEAKAMSWVTNATAIPSSLNDD
jgi:hypothetical protein